MAYDIPNVPGVPKLLPSASGALPELLFADNLEGYGYPPSAWGVFLNGGQVIPFETFVSIDYRQGWSIADYPIEEGGFHSYDKVELPFDARVRFASKGTEESRQELLQAVEAVAKSLERYDVVTPEKSYHSCNVQHYDYRRTNLNGVGIIVIEMWLLEIRTTSSGALGNATDANGNPVTPIGKTDIPVSTPLPPPDPRKLGQKTAWGFDPLNGGDVTTIAAPPINQAALS